MTSALIFQGSRDEQSDKKAALSYSDFSHLEWLDSLPDHWKKIRLKYLAQEPLAYGANESALESNPDHPRFIRITDVNEDGSLRSETFKSLAPELAEPYLLEDGDILLARSGATIGKAFIYRREWGKACFAGYLIRLRSDLQKVVPQFLYYYTQSSSYWSQIYEGAIQATIQNFSAEKYGNILIPLPPKSEQQEIVFFLDRETAEIDALVAEKERMLALLEEKRQALTSHVVTRGLNPSTSLKSSGLDWLGDIPYHWQIDRAKNLFSTRDERSETGEEELLTVSHITGVTPRSEKQVYMFQAEDMTGYKRCLKGDFVTNTLWAWMGAMGVSSVDGIVSPDYHVYAFKGNLLPEFMELICRSQPFIAEVIRWSKGVWSSRLRLYPENFFEIRLPVPPKHEQIEIVEKIKLEDNRNQELKEALNNSIILLKERRSALITAAVTGQIALEDMSA